MKKSIFLFFAAILCSVSAWAFNITANYYVYFEKPSDWSNVSLLLGHNTWSQGYNFTKISNTNLYYWKTIKWDNATEYYFIDATGWGGEGKKPTDRKGYASHASSKFTTNFSKYHLFTSSKEVKKDASSYATAVNRTQTIKVQLKDGSNWVDATVVPADLTASTYALTSSTAAGAKSASLAKESTTVSATVDAAYSATVSLSCTNILDGYMFEGWYDANGSKITSYTVSDAHTVYARFIQSAEETNAVSVTYMCGTTSVATAINETVGVESKKSFTAPTVTGYKFTNWTIGAGIDLKAGTASDATITVVTKSASSDYTLVANYEEVIETIYFINTNKWARVNIHKWNGKATASSWPGEKLTASGEKIGEYDVYSYTAKQGDYANIIFNSKTSSTDAGNAQTGDLTWTAGKYYIYNYGGNTGWYTKEEAEALLVVPVVEETIYFVNNKKWTKVQAYAWNSTSNNTWPGVVLTATGEKVADYDVYSYTAPQGYVNVIFNNKTGDTGVQSADFVWTNGKYYYMDAADNYAGGTAEEVAAALAVPVVTYDYYIAGSMNSWNESSEDYGMSDDDEDGIYEKTLTLKSNDEFKVKGTAWYGFDAIEGTYKETSSAGDKNIKVTFTTDTEVTVKFNSETKKITFEGLTVIEDYYTVVGVAELFGEAWAPANDANKMEKQGDGSYKLVKENVTLAAIGYDWKIAKNGNWWDDAATGVNPSEGNNTLTITTAGRYNVTFTLAADLTSATVETELLEATVVIPDCYISGNATLTGGEGWQGNEFTMVYDEATETWSYTLAGLQPEKAYELKVVCGGTWKSYADLTSVPAGVTQGNDNAIAFKMAEAGDVTVTYNVEAGITISGNFYVVVKYDYYITGCEKLGANWGANVEAFGMTDENEDKTYEKALTLAAGEYYLKVTDGTWTDGKNWGSAALSEKYTEISDSEGNIKITLTEEKTFTVKFNSETKKISFEGLTPDETPTKYYIVGSFNDWNTADPNYELILDGEVYKKEVTFAKDVQFKVCDGTWVNSWGKDNLGSKLYNELAENGENIQMKEDKTFTVIFDGSKITFEGLTEKAPAVVTYVLMGVNNDWTTGIPMTENPDKAGEYKLTCQAISATDAVKVVKLTDGVIADYYGNGTVKDGVEVAVNYDGDGNITLPEGTYDFYFDTNEAEKKLWIAAATYTRDVTPGSFSTICLPYAGTISGATLFDLSDRDENYVYVVEAGIELEAGKPYVILPTEDKITVTYKNYDYVTAGSYNALYGTYEDMDATALDGKYVISGNKYYYVDAVQSAGSKLLANRAYFNLYDLPTVAPVLPVGARRIALGTNGQNTATGMENVDASAQPVKTIINGQLYILRGEKMYDAQGKLVK